ncbi:MAG: uncharacterized protein PWQ37_2031 [Candidatus Petromonas sp.]|jgi:predicted DNA-binding protein YlxM (UPF0122 family)|nr:uncharacterized protein [Candidatus Petromonas sp.]
MIEKKIRLGNLYAFYGNLLTEKQKEILKLYCIHDLSLGEISENLNISRQAVYDTLKRAENTLEDYEEKLNLLSKFSNTRYKINELLDLINKFVNNIDTMNFNKNCIISEVNEIKKTAMEILDESS